MGWSHNLPARWHQAFPFGGSPHCLYSCPRCCPGARLSQSLSSPGHPRCKEKTSAVGRVWIYPGLKASCSKGAHSSCNPIDTSSMCQRTCLVTSVTTIMEVLCYGFLSAQMMDCCHWPISSHLHHKQCCLVTLTFYLYQFSRNTELESWGSKRQILPQKCPVWTLCLYVPCSCCSFCLEGSAPDICMACSCTFCNSLV